MAPRIHQPNPVTHFVFVGIGLAASLPACDSSSRSGSWGSPASETERERLTRECVVTDSADACGRLGDSLQSSKDGPEDLPLARTAHGKACTAGRLDSCASLCAMAFHGEGGATDLRLSREKCAAACVPTRARACSILGDLEHAGAGGPQDWAAAIRHSAMACQADPTYCWNAGEYAELERWRACESSITTVDRTKLKVNTPELYQGSNTTFTEVEVPDRYETKLKERGIIFRETYLETRRIPGWSYTTSETTPNRYAELHVQVTNDTCADLKVRLDAEFYFKAIDLLKRGILAAIACEIVKDKKKCAKAWKMAGEPLKDSAEGIVPAGERRLLTAMVDTQSVFGNNREMERATIASFQVDWPSDERCRPACLQELRALDGELTAVRAQYERGCKVGGEARICGYLAGVDRGHDEAELREQCHDGKPPNFEGACWRLRFLDWLRPPGSVL